MQTLIVTVGIALYIIAAAGTALMFMVFLPDQGELDTSDLKALALSALGGLFWPVTIIAILAIVLWTVATDPSDGSPPRQTYRTPPRRRRMLG